MNPQMTMIERVARALAGRDDAYESKRVIWNTRAKVAIEAMRDVPELCYDRYRCDKPWRELNSTEVFNLWIDAALTEDHSR